MGEFRHGEGALDESCLSSGLDIISQVVPLVLWPAVFSPFPGWGYRRRGTWRHSLSPRAAETPGVQLSVPLWALSPERHIPGMESDAAAEGSLGGDSLALPDALKAA